MAILFHSTNNKNEKVCFREAILNGMASNYGLYMMDKNDIPKLTLDEIKSMKKKNYSEIAFQVLFPFVTPDINEKNFLNILKNAYKEDIMPTEIQHITGKTYILWLSNGPTYSFKDYAARFFGRVLNHFLSESGLKRVVIVATSGDTGGAVADALYGLENVSNIIFFPEGSISEAQRRQMTTLKDNIYAFSVNGDFDVCQEIAKNLLGDKDFSKELFNDQNLFTSANSISLGRLLPQTVYPFFAYSRLNLDGQKLITSIPSGNFGDMMGTVIAKYMGLPIKKILCGVNENKEFPEFLKTGKYKIKPSVWSPSTAMIVSHPSNLERLIEFYGGHIYDKRDKITKKITNPGLIDKMPDLEALKRDIYTRSVNNQSHYNTIKYVYDKYGILLEPHGSVAFKTLEDYLNKKQDIPAIIYETADPGKFPEDIKKAVGIIPDIPEGIKKQKPLEERVFRISSEPSIDITGTKRMSELQFREAKSKIVNIFS